MLQVQDLLSRQYLQQSVQLSRQLMTPVQSGCSHVQSVVCLPFVRVKVVTYTYTGNNFEVNCSRDVVPFFIERFWCGDKDTYIVFAYVLSLCKDSCRRGDRHSARCI